MSEYKILNTSSKNQFIEEFGEELGTRLYRFYRNKINMSGASGKSKRFSLSERRLRNAKHLINTYGAPAVTRAMEVFEEKLDSGVLSNKSLPYFEAIVKSSTTKVTTQEPKPKEIVETIIPEKNERVFEHFSRELLNWNFKCNCGEIVDPWMEKCPKCKIWLGWDKVDLGGCNG